MTIIKTAYAIGPALDWMVAKAEDLDPETLNYRTGAVYSLAHGGWFSPSTNWGQGGPIIERERITLRVSTMPSTAWAAFYDVPGEYHARIRQRGPTPLIAACRCFVASKLGDSVEVPDELIKED